MGKRIQYLPVEVVARE